MTHLGRFFRQRRVEIKLSLGQLAERAGYRNLNRGSNRIKTLENGGEVRPDPLGKLADVLEISAEPVHRLRRATIAPFKSRQFGDLPDNPAGVASGEDPIGHIPRDNAASPDNRSGADSDARTPPIRLAKECARVYSDL